MKKLFTGEMVRIPLEEKSGAVPMWAEWAVEVSYGVELNSDAFINHPLPDEIIERAKSLSRGRLLPLFNRFVLFELLDDAMLWKVSH